jgi:uncharacterized protein (DUF362 family)
VIDTSINPNAVAMARIRRNIGARGYEADEITNALSDLAHKLGWSSPDSVLGSAINAGARVLIKPNWVLHENRGPWGLDPMITHHSVVKAAAEAALTTKASRVVVGDAPIQSCDFDKLLEFGDLKPWAEDLARRDKRFQQIKDFRRTRSELRGGVQVQAENQAAESEFVLFDLGSDSLLESVTTESNDFRVTQYDPERMARTHSRGHHQYLVARDAIEADVVINLPKLKTHKKAGITCALKNLVGINGNKEFLPHHRVGGAAEGGDCYPGRSRIKRSHEALLDLVNSSRSHLARRLLNLPARTLSVLSAIFVDPLGAEGSWSGNDTVWRMCLDLNRILLYGRTDGTLADTPQRKILHVADAGVAGQGDGPLAAEPFNLGVLYAGGDAPLMDLVGAQLLGYDSARLPIVTRAFDSFRWPITRMTADDLRLLRLGPESDWEKLPLPAYYPEGWVDSVDAASLSRHIEGRFWRSWQQTRQQPA